MAIAPLPHPLAPEIIAEVRRLYREAGPIASIKYLREQTSWGLKEAKDAVAQHLITDEDRAAERVRRHPPANPALLPVILRTFAQGDEAWTSGVYQNAPCGCSVVGNGTSPHPLMPKLCKAHARLALTATVEDEDAVRECGCGSGLHPSVCHERPSAPAPSELWAIEIRIATPDGKYTASRTIGIPAETFHAGLSQGEILRQIEAHTRGIFTPPGSPS